MKQPSTQHPPRSARGPDRTATARGHAVARGATALRTLLCMLAWLVLAADLRAADVQRIRARCPLCEAKFTYRLVIHESRNGLRLDFKQFGNPHSPTELPECPKCRFVMPIGIHGDLEKREIETLRELVRSDRYRAALDETTYFRLALALETLGRPPEDIAFAYVAASWQVDDNPIRCQVYLARSLVWYDIFLARPAAMSPARVRAMLLRAEILRRLGRFAEAGMYLAEITHHPALAEQHEQNVIQQQKDLVLAQDDHPHLAVAEDARVDITMRVVTPGLRAIRPVLAPQSRLPAFPSGPYAARLSGAVVVQISVTRSGYVVSCNVKSASTSAFARSVERSAQEWVFEPEHFDGAPSPLMLECTVFFSLEG